MNTYPESSAARFERILAEMGAEAPQARVERWRGQFDKLVGAYATHLVLFGAGDFGKTVLARLRKAGVQPLCFADNNPASWGSRIGSIEVLEPSDAVRQFGQTASFIVTIFNGSSTRKQLREMGCKCVLAAPLLFWRYPDEFMPDLGIDVPERLIDQMPEVRKFCSFLSDEQSRQELCDQIEWRYWMRPEYLPLPSNVGELYFPSDLVTENSAEVLVDCGAFDGDSARSFMRRGTSFRHLYALEPDAANRTHLLKSISNLPEEIQKKITVMPYAVGDEDGQVTFVETHDVASKVSASSDGTTIESRKLDSLPWQFKPTYIKMDIEGSEPLALVGGAKLLRAELPVLAICLYHRTEHLWQIPNLIHSLAPEYSIYLRRYAEDCWEQVCYAIPPGRLKTESGFV